MPQQRLLLKYSCEIIAAHQRFYLGYRAGGHLDLDHSIAGRPVNRAPGIRRRGGLMELRTRLNVLAAIVSFAFLTAVVFGMF